MFGALVWDSSSSSLSASVFLVGFYPSSLHELQDLGKIPLPVLACWLGGCGLQHDWVWQLSLCGIFSFWLGSGHTTFLERLKCETTLGGTALVLQGLPRGLPVICDSHVTPSDFAWLC